MIQAIILLSCSCLLALCEVPPPYYQRGFRPSPQYKPTQIQKITSVEIPTKLTLEQLIRLTEQLQNSRGRYQTLPQSSYFPPVKFQNQWKPQTTYGAPSNNQLRPPATSYGVPDVRNIETFENLLNDLNRQRLPNKSPSGFKPQQYLPPKVNEQEQGTSFPSTTVLPPTSYIPPPQTTPVSIISTSSTTAPVTSTVGGPKNFDYDYDLQQSSTDSPSEAGPNISISNAVAGPGGFFYLQQPDGRLQRVVLQKTQEPNSKPEEYVANYYFQNIQPLPNTVYAPLISLGSYTTKK